MKNCKPLGSILILTGTAIGAGMLALPAVSSAAGFSFSLLALISIWALMTFTGLLVLEVTLSLETYHNNFTTMARVTLGPIGEAITWICSLLLLYALTSAYIAGAGSILSETLSAHFQIDLPLWVNAVGFTAIFGTVVYSGARNVDYFNRGLISIKGISLVLVIVLLMPQVDFIKLLSTPSRAKYMIGIFPIFLTAFGFHHVIPSMANYLGPQPKVLRNVVIFGALTPMLIYFFWMIATLGIIPLFGPDSFQYIAQHNQDAGSFIHVVKVIAHHPLITKSVNVFANVAVTTSFLGVTLGFFDFLADGFKRPNTKFGRLQTAMMTFIPPLFFALKYPEGFVIALTYAAIFVAVLQIVLPALMAYSLRSNPLMDSPYRAPGNRLFLIIIACLGITIIAIDILNELHYLPVMNWT